LARARGNLANFSNQRRTRSSARGRADLQPGRLRSPFFHNGEFNFPRTPMIAREIVKKLRQIELRTNRIVTETLTGQSTCCDEATEP